jgi:hypothetical protein
MGIKGEAGDWIVNKKILINKRLNMQHQEDQHVSYQETQYQKEN